MALIHTLLALISDLTTLAALLCILPVLLIVYRVYLHPLSHVPGPFLARISSLYLYFICWEGKECSSTRRHHFAFKTPVLRIAPNAVSISDGSALHKIYVENGGFRKSQRYQNFRVDGHDTIFSTLDGAYRDVRAKVVLPLFAMGRVRAAADRGGAIKQCVDEFVELLRDVKINAQSQSRMPAIVEILDLAQRLTIDVTTGYLFGKRYGGLDEGRDQLVRLREFKSDAAKSRHVHNSAAPFIFAIIEFGRYSLLPTYLFQRVLAAFMFLGRMFPNEDFDNSIRRVSEFSNSLVAEADTKDDTYQGRLLSAGIGLTEAAAQCKAVTFAGTDSTATKLVTIMFHLAQNPGCHAKLEAELHADSVKPSTDPQTLPYLRAVVKEGLRLGQANPARFTRVVPNEGLQVGDVAIPGGTIVGCAPYTLHHNPDLFPEPFTFRPERWLEHTNDMVSAKASQHRANMDRDLIPFSLGLRTCLARNLATHELFVATRALVESGVLKGAKTVKDNIELDEVFNAGIKGHHLELEWPSN